MSTRNTSAEVWESIDQENFAVLGMVTKRDESRTAGICYVVDDHKIYIGASRSQWKTKHVAQNPAVSLTVVISRRIPFLPWIKVPATTITFKGTARVLGKDDLTEALFQKVYRHDEETSDWCAIEVTPAGDFITYGLRMSALQMRHPDRARARTPVSVA